MILKFLGTGAADRMNLQQDDDFSNKDHRRCSCALLNGHIMIDCGPHALNALKAAEVSLYDITDIVITHRHVDHFNIDNINKIAECGGVRLWLRDGAIISGCNAQVIYMKLFKQYIIDDLTVTGLPANHEPDVFPQHLYITNGDKKLYYALDGAWILNETVKFLKGVCLDAIVLDATVGDYSGDYRMGEHNSVPMVRLMVDSMRTLKIIGDKTKIILSHIACCLHKSHEETQRILDNDGFIAAYDGFCVEI